MQIGANANWPKTHTHLYYMQTFNCDYSISSTDNPPSWTDGFSVLFLAVILDHFGCFFFSFCSSTGNGPGMSQCFITSCDSIGNHCILFGHTEWCVTAPTHFACISSLTPTYYGPSEHTNQSHSAARIDESSLIVVFFSHEHSAVQFNARRATENYPAKRSRVQNMCVDTRPL